MGIPAICSIPAVFHNGLAFEKHKDNVACSDALLYREHLYWVWRHPHPTNISGIQFVGPRLTNEHYVPIDRKGRSRLVYVCFGK